MHEVPNVIACEGCDALYARPHLRRGEIARCARCDCELDRHPGRQHERILPLTIACLVLFFLANIFPIVEIQLGGVRSQTTLLGAVVALAGEGMALVAVIVLATTILFPLGQLTVLLYLLMAAPQPGPPAGFDWLIRSIQSLRPWGMIEVFLLGVLVAIVKLSSWATIQPGAALWAFVALALLLTAVLSFDPRVLWDGRGGGSRIATATTAPGRDTDGTRAAAATARELGMIGCRHCATVWQNAREGARCGHCGAHLHSRKPDSLNRTWALLITACILYLPANLLPVMSTRSLFGVQEDTILSGVIYFWVAGDWALAAIIFIASFLVPLFKLSALMLMAVAARRRSAWARPERTRLYRVVEVIGRWSMLDVFVVSLLAGLVRFHNVAEITASPGIASFGSVVVLTMLASISFDPRIAWDAAATRADPASRRAVPAPARAMPAATRAVPASACAVPASAPLRGASRLAGSADGR